MEGITMTMFQGMLHACSSSSSSANWVKQRAVPFSFLGLSRKLNSFVYMPNKYVTV